MLGDNFVGRGPLKVGPIINMIMYGTDELKTWLSSAVCTA